MQWTPTYNMVVIEAGDEYAVHSGSTGGIHIGSPQVVPVQKTEEIDEQKLGVWIKWLETVDFD